MTLIAAFELYGVPLLMGDIVVSSPNGIPPPSGIPTLTDSGVLARANSSNIIQGMTRKVSHIRPDLVVAWAGHCIAARHVLQDMYTNRNQLDSVEQVERYFNSIDIGGLTLELVAMFVESGRARTALIAWNSGQIWPCGPISAGFASGSGYADFVDVLARATFPVASTEPREKLTQAVLAGLSISGQLLGDQMRVNLGIPSCFGGAYELVYVESGVPRSVEYTLYALQLDDLAGKEKKITFKGIIKVALVREWLYVRRHDFVTEPSMDGLYEEKKSIYLLGPAHLSRPEPFTTEEIEGPLAPAMSSKFEVFYVYSPSRVDSSGSPIIKSIVHWSGSQGNGCPAVLFNRDGNALEITLSEQLVQRLARIT